MLKQPTIMLWVYTGPEHCSSHFSICFVREGICDPRRSRHHARACNRPCYWRVHERSGARKELQIEPRIVQRLQRAYENDPAPGAAPRTDDIVRQLVLPFPRSDDCRDRQQQHREREGGMCPLEPEVCLQLHTDGGVLPRHGEEMKLANSGHLAGAQHFVRFIG